MYIFNDPKEFFEPLYQTKVKIFPWEFELLHTKTLRRLKHLSHYGTGSFITTVKHSRFEHTIGVFTVIATFFPDEEELRIAALLHDIGHLPFSHAVEKTLSFNHHQLTEQYIKEIEVASILDKYGFSADRVIALLNDNSPLSHQTPYLSADHFDSFMRDAYMNGKSKEHPAEVFKRISFQGNYIEADLQTSRTIMHSIHADHANFLSPVMVCLDALLAKAITIYAAETEVELGVIQRLVNSELIQLLREVKIDRITNILDTIMYNPERLSVYPVPGNELDEIRVVKIYDKTPLVDGAPLTAFCEESQVLMGEIRAMKKTYYFGLD
ncbi:HD domain-containing protein [Radiobacillus sp. PE A8.2]|uniref:HD domain-containing protein n=1 Tax=Radiobacillus sp. PE A8.2 TaxID=3380349 RepID=UPI003890C1A8